jgi:hypothetical protein
MLDDSNNRNGESDAELLLHLGGRQLIADLPRSESFQMVSSSDES